VAHNKGREISPTTVPPGTYVYLDWIPTRAIQPLDGNRNNDQHDEQGRDPRGGGKMEKNSIFPKRVSTPLG
ncbi:unnamed protein product, partial [Amoebophrya sp. A120]